jgi:aldehyde dehydrogenase (NAD+)
MKNLVGGDWVDPGGDSFESRDPFSGDVVAVAPVTDVAGVDAAVGAARSSFDRGDWRRRRGADRARALLALADALEAREREAGELMAREMGKPVRVARGREVAGAIDRLRFFAGSARQLEGRITAAAVPELWDMEVPEPVGVCALIIPWNDPIDLAVRKMAAALAVGCSVVLKPSELTPASTALLVELAHGTGLFPDGVVNLVHGPGDPTGEALVAHPGVDKVSFTGSTETGRRIMEVASRRLAKVSLECGGKAPAIVFGDADLDTCADALTYGAFMYAGQSCTACTRLIVDTSVHDELVEKIAERSERLPVGNPMDESNLVGPMVSQRQKAKAARYLQEGIHDGGRVMVGGAPDSDDLFFPPTVLADVPAGSAVSREEIFGPVLATYRFSSPEEAIELANGTPFGLGGAVWTRDIGRALDTARALDVADVWVNTHYVRHAETSFGGRHLSGIGRELGVAGALEYVAWKRVCIDTRTSFHLKDWFDRGEEFRS